jgi:microcystin-dependent protein
MSQPFIGQIIAVGFNFAPVGWALCAGQSLPISEYSALYTLIGTTYGGDGTSSFNLPDLRGRAAVNQGQGAGLSNYVLGEPTGTEQVTLLQGQIGMHTHTLMAASSANASTPTTGTVLGTPASEPIYLASGATVNLSPTAVTPLAGGNQPHDNLQPYQTINYIIALFGIFPQQS